MNQERDKFLTEATGGCWHQWNQSPTHSLDVICIKCGHRRYYKQQNDDKYNFSTWEDFGKLWEWVRRQKWLWDSPFYDATEYGIHTIKAEFINPDRFADAVYEFLKEKK